MFDTELSSCTSATFFPHAVVVPTENYFFVGKIEGEGSGQTKYEININESNLTSSHIDNWRVLAKQTEGSIFQTDHQKTLFLLFEAFLDFDRSARIRDFSAFYAGLNIDAEKRKFLEITKKHGFDLSFLNPDSSVLTADSSNPSLEELPSSNNPNSAVDYSLNRPRNSCFSGVISSLSKTIFSITRNSR